MRMKRIRKRRGRGDWGINSTFWAAADKWNRAESVTGLQTVSSSRGIYREANLDIPADKGSAPIA